MLFRKPNICGGAVRSVIIDTRHHSIEIVRRCIHSLTTKRNHTLFLLLLANIPPPLDVYRFVCVERWWDGLYDIPFFPMAIMVKKCCRYSVAAAFKSKLTKLTRTTNNQSKYQRIISSHISNVTFAFSFHFKSLKDFLDDILSPPCNNLLWPL